MPPWPPRVSNHRHRDCSSSKLRTTGPLYNIFRNKITFIQEYVFERSSLKSVAISCRIGRHRVSNHRHRDCSSSKLRTTGPLYNIFRNKIAFIQEYVFERSSLKSVAISCRHGRHRVSSHRHRDCSSSKLRTTGPLYNIFPIVMEIHRFFLTKWSVIWRMFLVFLYYKVIKLICKILGIKCVRHQKAKPAMTTTPRVCQHGESRSVNSWNHNDVIKWKQFPRYWPFV